MTIALLADIVGSRLAEDRSDVQAAVEDAAARVETDLPRARQALHATVGDEFQAVYDVLGDALAAALLIALSLPDGVECRFGIGAGEIRDVRSSAPGIQDGSAWWAARAAIVALEDPRRPRRSRSWFAASDEVSADLRSAVAPINAGLLARDQVLGEMSGRARRLVYGAWAGTSQQMLAQTEGVSQSAVSQSLARPGAQAILAGLDELVGRPA